MAGRLLCLVSLFFLGGMEMRGEGGEGDGDGGR